MCLRQYYLLYYVLSVTWVWMTKMNISSFWQVGEQDGERLKLSLIKDVYDGLTPLKNKYI